MTRYELAVGQIVLHGFPPSMAEGLGPLVEGRLAQLAGYPRSAGARSAAQPVPGQERLAGLVADRIWTEARQVGMPTAGGRS